MNPRGPMKTKKIYSFITCFFLQLFLFSLLSAQQAELYFRTNPSVEWSFFDTIARGELYATPIQTRAKTEYTAERKAEPFFSGFVSANLYSLGWSGLNTGRWAQTNDQEEDSQYLLQDPSYRQFFHLERPVFEFGIRFGSEHFFATTAINFNTDSISNYARDNSGKGLTGFWNPSKSFSYWLFPELGYLSYSTENTLFAIGRFPTGIGFGQNNIFLNGKASYDQAQIQWHTKGFRFFMFAGTSASHLNQAEWAVQSMTSQNTENGESKSEWGWDSLNNHDASTQNQIPLKLFTYHRIEFTPFSKIGLGLSEMQLVGGKVPEIANLLPTNYWHNTYSAGISNVMILADFWITPLPSVMLWGEYLMDDSKSPAEDERAKPRSWAWSLGGIYVLPLHYKDFKTSFMVEYSHVDEWTYNRWQPWLTMYQRQILTGGHRGFDSPLGHSLGGDLDSISVRLVSLSRKAERVELSYTFTAKGPVYLGRIWTGTGKDLDGDGTGDTVYIPIYYDFDWWYEQLVGDETLNLDSFLAVPPRYIHDLNLTINWPLKQALTAHANINTRFTQNAAHIKNKTTTELIWSLGIAWQYGKN